LVVKTEPFQKASTVALGVAFTTQYPYHQHVRPRGRGASRGNHRELTIAAALRLECCNGAMALVL
jgi:hypothetical protein